MRGALARRIRASARREAQIAARGCLLCGLGKRMPGGVVCERCYLLGFPESERADIRKGLHRPYRRTS